MASVIFEIKDSVGSITLNRPDKLNSFNGEMALRLQEALRQHFTSIRQFDGKENELAEYE